MLNKRTQVVIGVAVLIISAAFLLVGIYFAELQGILFQNGANSLQLFANNIAAAKNALYLAPSSMQITLSGNNSLCTWDSAIDAYNCAGGAKIYNVSYTTGPTLDTGQSMFSVALCFFLTVGPKGGKGVFGSGGEASSESTSLALRSESALSEGASAIGTAAEQETTLSDIQGIIDEIKADPGLAAGFEQGKVVVVALDGGVGTASARTAAAEDLQILATNEGISQEAVNSIVEDEASTEKPLALLAPSSEAQVQKSFLGRLVSGIKSARAFTKAHPQITSLLTNLGMPALQFWIGYDAPTISNYLTSGYSAASNAIGGLSNNAVNVYNTLVASYETAQVVSPNLNAANLQLVQYAGFISSMSDINNLPAASVASSNAIQDAVGEANVLQSESNQLAAFSNQNANSNYNLYSTPSQGVSAPQQLSSSGYQFVGPAKFVGSGDPILAATAFLAQKGFLVYGETASCLGTMPQGLNANSALSDAAEIYGAVTSPLDVYGKLNEIDQIGTYFVGYGGEAYINGQSNGRPTTASAPIIADMADMCGIVQSSVQPGFNLNTIVAPAGNGSLSFSISQGLYNTICSPDSKIYPKSLSTFVNQILTAQNGDNVSIYVSPQYAIGMTNSADSTICVFNLVLNGYGNPVQILNNVAVGIPGECINLYNTTNGTYNLAFLGRTGAGATFLNSNSTVMFSAPLSTGSNYIASNTITDKVMVGLEIPALRLAQPYIKASWFQQIANGLQGEATIPPLFSGQTPNQAFYPTEYVNLTFKVLKTSMRGGVNISLVPVGDNVLFGVYPNSPNVTGGTYFSQEQFPWQWLNLFLGGG